MSLKAENDMGDMVWSLANYTEFFKEQVYWLTFVRVAIYSILVTFLTFAVTFPIAFYITKITSVKYKGFLMILLLIPFWSVSL